MSNEKSRLEWAQWMADKGINVFAVSPNSKRPLEGLSWYLRQSTEAETIKGFFDITENCNYGLHLGHEYVVIDLDLKPQHNGVKAFEAICRENGVDDFTLEIDTLMVKTPGGGYHLYFQAPFACINKNKFPDGIDVRGVNGYVVGPGSADSRGEWKMVDPSVDIAPLPKWLEGYMVQPGYKDPDYNKPLIEWDLSENIDHALDWLLTREHATEGANGDDWTYETCQYMRDFGLSESAALKALNADWNQRCAPPWDLELLEAKIANAFEYGQNRPGCKSPTWKAQRVMLGHGGDQWAAHLTPEALAEMFHPQLSLVVDNTKPADDEDIPDDVTDDELDPVTGNSAEVSIFSGFNAFKNKPAVRDYVVRQWLIDHSITHMIARRGTGKSTLALNLAAHIATDQEHWSGVLVRPDWKVLYICGEDTVGMRLNCRAWVKHYGVEVSDDRFLVADDIIKMTDLLRLRARLMEIKRWAGDSRVVTVLDTWQRSTSGWSKSDQELMEKAVERAELFAKSLRGPLLSLVHPPKNGPLTVVGSGIQEDTSSGIYHVEELANGDVRMKIDRVKGPGKGQYLDFKLKVIEMEELDAFGYPLTGIVAIETAPGVSDTVATATSLTRKRIEGNLAITQAVGDILVGAQEDTERHEMDLKTYTMGGMAERLEGCQIKQKDGNEINLKQRALTERLKKIFISETKDGEKMYDNHVVRVDDVLYSITLGEGETRDGRSEVGGKRVAIFLIKRVACPADTAA